MKRCRKNCIAIVSLLDLAPPESVCTTVPCKHIKKSVPGDTPNNGLYGQAPLEAGTLTFSGLRYIEIERDFTG